MAQYEASIFHVKCQIEHCIKQLHYANCDYQSLSTTLSKCVNYLQSAKKKNETLKSVTTLCKKKQFTPVYCDNITVILITFLFITITFLCNIHPDQLSQYRQIPHLVLLLSTHIVVIYYAPTVLTHRFDNNNYLSLSYLDPIITPIERLLILLSAAVSGIVALASNESWLIIIISFELAWIAGSHVFLSLQKVNFSFLKSSCLYAVTAAMSTTTFLKFISSGLKPTPIRSSLCNGGFAFAISITIIGLCGIIACKKKSEELIVLVVGLLVGLTVGTIANEPSIDIIVTCIIGNHSGIGSAVIYLCLSELISVIENDRAISKRILGDNIQLLTTTTNEIKELLTRLLHAEHPYSHTYSPIKD